MRKINYKSDFDFILRLTDADGEPIGFPSYDWTLNIYTRLDKNTVFTASSVDGELTNCFNDDGAIHIVCDSHGLGKGNLYGEFYADIPNVIYADGIQLTVTPFSLGITLVDAASDGGGEIEIDNTVPMVFINAYELAVKQGFVGTEEEFYSALTRLPNLVGEADDKMVELEQAATQAQEAIADTQTQAQGAIKAAQSAAEQSILQSASDAQQGISEAQHNAQQAIDEVSEQAQEVIVEAQQALEETRQGVSDAIAEGAAAVISSTATLRLDRETGRILLTIND